MGLVNVQLQNGAANCVYPQSETVYVVHVMIHQNFQLVAQNTVITQNTSNDLVNVPLPQFCTGDSGPYQILVEAAKVDINTKEELCRDKTTVPNEYTCTDFSGGSPDVDLIFNN